MIEWVVKIGPHILNILHPAADWRGRSPSREEMRERAMKLRDRWNMSGLFPGETVYFTEEDV